MTGARMIVVSGTLAVFVHAVVALLHGRAHAELGVELSLAQGSFVAIVIVLVPFVATGLLWTRFRWAGALLLAASMAGALVFGLYHHYVAVSPDHVDHLPGGEARGLFRLTALLLVATEALGLAVGAAGWRILSRTAPSGSRRR